MAPIPTYVEDPYVAQELLGRGGFSVVQKVVHRQDPSKAYARKSCFLSTSEDARKSQIEAIDNEIQIMRSLNHPHVVKVMEAYHFRARHLSIIMDPVADVDLLAYLYETEEADGAERSQLQGHICRWFGCLAKTLYFLHQKGIRHKDIKSSNILVRDGQVFLADFGIAKEMSLERTTGTQGTVGPHTVAYAAPEVLRGDRRSRSSDVFSLGCVFLEMYAAACGQGGLSAMRSSVKGVDGGTLVYAKAPQAILRYLQSGMRQVRDRKQDPMLGAVLDLVFLMMDPNPQTRITMAQVAELLCTRQPQTGPSLADLNRMSCSQCSQREVAFNSRYRYHSITKPLTERDFSSGESLSDWESAKRAWLRYHMYW